MGLEVDNNDINKLVEKHSQELTIEELMELHRALQQEFTEESLLVEEEEMARQYTRFKYTEDDLTKAIHDVNNGGLSLNKASLKYAIPKSTLHNKITAKVPNVRKMGPAPTLNQTEEQRLENWILAKAKLGFPMHADEVKDAVQNILKDTGRQNKFEDDRPGVKWLQLFLKRHPNISKRNTEIISKSRAAVTEAGIREWFSELKNYLQKENLLDTMMSDPSRIFNADETGMRTCMKSGKVLAPAKKFKNLYEIASGNEKESITVLCNYAAVGVAAPPMVVFPYKRLPKELALSVPLGWGIGRSDSGWMTAATFYEYVANIFYPWLIENNITLPIILFIDGHKSHYNLDLYEFCLEKKIILYCLFPNSTHILQPCDVSIFRPLKVQWKEACRRHKQRTSTIITRHNFCTLFKEAFDKACELPTIRNGFRICGLYPLDENAVDYSKCISTRRNEIFQTPEVVNITNDDYKSCLNVLHQYLSKEAVTSFERRLNEADENYIDDNLYNFWKHCRLQSNIERLISVQEADKENIIVTESFLDGLPIEIDGMLYPPMYEHDLISECESVINNIEGKQSGSFPFNLKDTTKSLVQIEADCLELLEIILENVFSITAEVQNTNNTSVTDKTENKNNENKVHVISNILIKTNKKTEDTWNKHLHWPQLPESKRKNSRPLMPYAITSNKWIEFHNEQQRKKEEQEDNLLKKRLEKEKKKEERDITKLQKIKEKEIKKLSTKNKKQQKGTGFQQEQQQKLFDDTDSTTQKRKLDEGAEDQTLKRKKEEKTNEGEDKKESDAEGQNLKQKNEEKTNEEEDKKESGAEEQNLKRKKEEKTNEEGENKKESGNKRTDQCGRTSSHKNENEESSDELITVGTYVFVKYGNKNYPGIVKSVEDDDFEVSVMHKVKKQWRWPDTSDQVWYKRSQIVKTISESNFTKEYLEI